MRLSVFIGHHLKVKGFLNFLIMLLRIKSFIA